MRDLHPRCQLTLIPSLTETRIDSYLDSDTPLPSSLVQRKVSRPSGGAGTSTFLPALSVGCIPGTGDSDPEDEPEGGSGREDRRGQ